MPAAVDAEVAADRMEERCESSSSEMDAAPSEERDAGTGVAGSEIEVRAPAAPEAETPAPVEAGGAAGNSESFASNAFRSRSYQFSSSSCQRRKAQHIESMKQSAEVAGEAQSLHTCRI